MESDRPKITDPALLRRLELGPAAFHDFLVGHAASLGNRSIRDARFHRAFKYPFERLGFSFLAGSDRVYPLVDARSQTVAEALVVVGNDVVPAGQVAGVIDAVENGGPEPARFPLLSYGANVSVEGIGGKIDGLTGHDSILPVICGDLLDFDVVYSPHLTLYGALPSTIHPCRGVSSPVAVLLATENQITAIAQLELNYRFGWLTGAAFHSPVADVSGDLYSFVSRHGTFAPDREPLALAAVETQSRTFPGVLSKGALEIVSGILDRDSAEDVVFSVLGDYGWAIAQHPRLAEHALPFEAPAWVDYPG